MKYHQITSEERYRISALRQVGYGEEFLKIDTLGPERRNRRVTVRPITDLIRPQT